MILKNDGQTTKNSKLQMHDYSTGGGGGVRLSLKKLFDNPQKPANFRVNTIGLGLDFYTWRVLSGFDSSERSFDY